MAFRPSFGFINAVSSHARDVMVVVVEVEVVELKPNRKYQQDHVTSEFERTWKIFHLRKRAFKHTVLYLWRNSRGSINLSSLSDVVVPQAPNINQFCYIIVCSIKCSIVYPSNK